MITISLCMIVKNEEKILARCLDSLQGLFDEVLIADTGSTDHTKEIASCYTDKIFDYEWERDFSKARNYILDKASSEYVYMADADEVLDDVNREKFLKLKESLDTQVDVVQMYYTNQLAFGTIYNYDKELRPKLFKRIKNIHFQDPIHETLALEPVIFDSEIEIRHLPQGEHTSRDLEAFRRLTADGVDLSKRLHNLYAKELFVSGAKEDFIQALDFFVNSVGDVDRGMDEIKEAACVVARALRLQENEVDFFKYVLKDISENPSSEMCFELGEYYFSKKDYDEAVVWYYNAAYETTSILDLRKNTVEPRRALAKCYEALNMPDEADKYIREAKEYMKEYGKEYPKEYSAETKKDV